MPQPDEVIFEFVRLGSTLKVIAVETATGTEVSVVVPATISPSDAERLALQKLRRRLGEASSAAPRPPSSGDGIIV
jgi:hypothetical protein